MSYFRPLSTLPTHEVSNQPPPLEDYNLSTEDVALEGAVERENGGWALPLLREFGEDLGSQQKLEWGNQANRFPPRLRAFDAYGRRIDEIEYHSSYHALMELAISRRVHSVAWDPVRPGGQVAHAALLYLLSQVEAGVCCPLSMTHSVIPALKLDPQLYADWAPRIFSTEYDSRCLPVEQKRGATFGMAMTEKQGGSDVRANSTQAIRLNEGRAYTLEGHKWFCSAPMSDAFLTLAQCNGQLTCFLVPRWKPDGSRNPFFIQRLKDKLGNRSNASAEVEYSGTWALRLGEEGRGINAIIPMVQHTRLDAAVAAASLMRQAFVQAAHHAAHRNAFGKPLKSHPLMQNVLADLALESEAAAALVIRIAGIFDEAASSPEMEGLGRFLAAAAKFWLNKRAPLHVSEALECLGGVGYVEESIMPRLYREAPLNGIWEGSGNVICLDLLRILRAQPETAELYLSQLKPLTGNMAEFDAALDVLKSRLTGIPEEGSLRLLTEQIAVMTQAAILMRGAPEWVAVAFCQARLQPPFRGYGTLADKASWLPLVRRGWPAIEG